MVQNMVLQVYGSVTWSLEISYIICHTCSLASTVFAFEDSSVSPELVLTGYGLLVSNGFANACDAV